MPASRPESKVKFLEAAFRVVRAKGYTATRIEDLCESAALTKGSFFHHFNSKEALALAAAEHWGSSAERLFVAAPYRTRPAPRDRILGYVDFRKALLTGELPEYTCLAGTIIQEIYGTNSAIRDAYEKTISDHAALLEPDIAAAMSGSNLSVQWTANSLALYTQAVIQGAFVLAKARNGPQVAIDCLDHLRRYLEMLFPH